MEYEDVQTFETVLHQQHGKEVQLPEDVIKRKEDIFSELVIEYPWILFNLFGEDSENLIAEIKEVTLGSR